MRRVPPPTARRRSSSTAPGRDGQAARCRPASLDHDRVADDEDSLGSATHPRLGQLVRCSERERLFHPRLAVARPKRRVAAPRPGSPRLPMPSNVSPSATTRHSSMSTTGPGVQVTPSSTRHGRVRHISPNAARSSRPATRSRRRPTCRPRLDQTGKPPDPVSGRIVSSHWPVGAAQNRWGHLHPAAGLGGLALMACGTIHPWRVGTGRLGCHPRGQRSGQGPRSTVL